MKNRKKLYITFGVTIFLVCLATFAFQYGKHAIQVQSEMEKQQKDKVAEDTYFSLKELWKDEANHSSQDILLKANQDINNVDTEKHPDAKELKLQIAHQLFGIYKKQADQEVAENNIVGLESTIHSIALFGNSEEEKSVLKDLQTKLDTIKNEIELKQAKDEMQKFKADSGTIGLAVSKFEEKDKVNSFVLNDQNYEYLLVAAHVVNAGKESKHVNPLDFVLVVNGEAQGPSTQSFGLSNYFDAIQLPAGDQHSGWLCFTVPKTANSYDLRFDDGFGDVATKKIVK